MMEVPAHWYVFGFVFNLRTKQTSRAVECGLYFILPPGSSKVQITPLRVLGLSPKLGRVWEENVALIPLALLRFKIMVM